ncbi:hypothetical protein [Nonomuraea typhae]|uniref:hypothetical protein n=1 Tax=Nonomuraea typhae TaxID=2603600 RepID=UPI0012FC2F12|nr:hypothetical protein [Nonomuraea typhae]
MGFPKKRSSGGDDEVTTETSQPTQSTQKSAMWSPYDEGPRSRGPLLFVVGGLAVLGLLVGGLVVMWNAGGPSPVSTSTRTSAPLPSAPPGKFGYAGERKTDPKPMTVKEIFGEKKFTVSGRSYEMTITKSDKKCGDAANGDKLAKALKSGKCTQVIRATFRDKSGKIIGTVGVANLDTTPSAEKVASAGAKGKRSVYVKALPGKDSVTKYVGSGSGAADIWTHGHYAIMVWFQNKDGSKADKKAAKKLAEAADDVTKATVFKALDGRSVNGFPNS